MATDMLSQALGTTPALVRGFGEKTGMKERAEFGRKNIAETFEKGAEAEAEAAKRQFDIQQGEIAKTAQAERDLAAGTKAEMQALELGTEGYKEFEIPQIKASDYAANASLRLLSSLLLGGVGGASGRAQLMAIKEMQDAEDRNQRQAFAAAKLKFDEADKKRKDSNEMLKQRFDRMLNLLSKNRNAALVEAKMIEGSMGDGLIAAQLRKGNYQKAYELFTKSIDAVDKADAELEKQRLIYSEKRNLALLRKGTGGGDGAPTKLEKGERWNPVEQRVEAVPGSKLFVKQVDDHGKDYRGLVSVETKTNSAIEKIKRITNPKNADAFDAAFSGNVPYSGYITGAIQQKAIDLNREIDSLKSDMKAAGLELIRQGGSIGQITEREWPIIEQMIASVSPSLSPAAAKDAFARVQGYLERIKNNAQNFYVNEYEDTQYYNPTAEIVSIRGGRQRAAAPKKKYSMGEILTRGNKKYRVTGLSDPENPDIEEVKE